MLIGCVKGGVSRVGVIMRWVAEVRRRDGPLPIDILVGMSS